MMKVVTMPRNSLLLVAFGLFFNLIVQSAAADSPQVADLETIRQMVHRGDYDDALPMLRELQADPGCDRECRGMSHMLAGYCRLMLGQERAAGDEVERALKLIPNYRPDSSEYSSEFLALLERTRAQVLCSVEVRITTPESMGLLSDVGINAVYRQENVPVGPIILLQSEYNNSQRYRLLPGRLNVFELTLEELHDYWSYDSLHISFRAASGKAARLPVGKAGSDRARIGRYQCDLLASNYADTSVTSLLVGDSTYLTRLAVVETRPAWKELHRDLASNHSRRKLNSILRYSSIVGAVVTSVWAWQSDREADDKYVEYMDAVDGNLISDTYRRYEDLIEKRNILGTFAVTFSAVAIGTFLFAPGTERDLIEHYEREHGPSGLYFGVGDQGVELKLRVGVS